MTRRALLWLTLAACLAGTVAITLLLALEKDHTISLARLANDPGGLAVVLAPLVLMALIAVWARNRLFSLVACLLAALVGGGWACLILWEDHLAWSRLPHGMEVQRMGVLGALLALYGACAVAAVLALAERVCSAVWGRPQNDPATPGPPP